MPSDSSFPPKKVIFPGEVFAETADFDRNIRQMVSRYEELHATLIDCLRPGDRVLELGCGTGELALQLLRRDPQARVVAVDYSPRMLAIAQQKAKAAGCQDRVVWVEADFGAWAVEASVGVSEAFLKKNCVDRDFDACVSALAIHHLSDTTKLQVFQQVRASLRPGGCFWNADPVLPESEALRKIYQRNRDRQSVPEDVRAKLGKTESHGYSAQDRVATLEAQLHMLRQAGFENVAVPWKYFYLAIFGGYAPA